MNFTATYNWKKDVSKYKIHFIGGRPLDEFSLNKYATASIQLFDSNLAEIGNLNFVSNSTDIYHAGDVAQTISNDVITLWYPYAIFDSLALLLANVNVSAYLYTLGTSPGLSGGIAFIQAGLGGGSV